MTVLRPVLNITKPAEVLKWHEKMLKYDQMKAKGGIHAMLARNKPKLPPQENVFDNPRYMEFLQFYFQIATALGAFQELGLIYFELMKDGLFKVRNICNKNVSLGPLFKLCSAMSVVILILKCLRIQQHQWSSRKSQKYFRKIGLRIF